MSPPPDLLFFDGDLDASLKHQAQQVVEEVEAAPEDHLLQVDEEAWVEALVEKWKVEAPELQTGDMWMDRPKEVQVDVSDEHFTRAIMDPSTPTYIPGHRVVVHIPFSGDRGVFNLTPRQRSMNPPRATVRDGEVIHVIQYPHDRKPNIRGEAEALAQSIDKHLGWARADIEQFNAALDQHARAAITARRDRVKANYAHLEETGLPMGPPSGQDSKTYISDAIVRRPAPVLPTSRPERPMALEPVLGDEAYEHILGVIRSMALTIERAPASYADHGEEDLRHVLLGALNTHYRGQTTAEGFNFEGKTDLLIRHEEHNIFIGECKYWSGASGFTDTIDQLSRYTAWRDTKLAIVMFVREQDLTTIISRARSALEEHPQFVGWNDAHTETELRATVHWSGDEERQADLNVFFVHLPKKN